MEITTYIENHTEIDLPQFKHPTKIISTAEEQTSDLGLDLFYTDNISVPDKILLGSSDLTEGDENVKCYLLYGYSLRLKDWQYLLKAYNINIKIKLYRGNQVTEISDNLCQAKSFLKGQKLINEPRTLIKKDQKALQFFVPMYTVEIHPKDETQPTRIIYYLPSTFNRKSSEFCLQSVKSRYFNHKILQILDQYVSLDNNNASCYKDLGHHQFQGLVYSGKVISFQIFIKLVPQQNSEEATQSFLEKLSQISMTDKHLLDEVDPLDFSQIKKQIRSMYLEEKRIRKSLTFEKIRIVQQIENTLQFLNLKELYPQKLTFNSITADMLKKIRSQNIEKKAVWIKQQNLILKNFQHRILELQQTKNRYKQMFLDQEKNNYSQIQAIRKQIKFLETNIRYEQSETLNDKFNNFIHCRGQSNSTNCQQQINRSKFNIKKEKKEPFPKNQVATSATKAQKRDNPISKLNPGKKNDQITKQEEELNLIDKQNILKYEMIRIEFEMEKQFMRRKSQYAKAAEDLLNYLVDC